MYAFIVSIILFTLGGCFALYEAWHKFSDPHPITSWQWVPVLVLVVAIVLEGFSLRTAVLEANRARGRTPLLKFVRRSRSPELPVILLEDIGALVGLVLALFGVSMTLATHDGRWDAIGSAAIGILLVVIASFLAVEMNSMLLGEAALPEHQDAIEAAVVGQGIPSLIHLRTMHLGPDRVLVAAKVAVEKGATAAEVAAAIDGAEARIRASVPIDTVIFLEPDLRRGQAAEAQATVE